MPKGLINLNAYGRRWGVLMCFPLEVLPTTLADPPYNLSPELIGVSGLNTVPLAYYVHLMAVAYRMYSVHAE